MLHDSLEKKTRIPFRVAGGKLVHFYDKKPIAELREGTVGDLIVNDFVVGDESRIRQYNAEGEAILLPQGTPLLVRISTQKVPERLKEWLVIGKKFIGSSAVEIILLEDLRLRLRGTKEAQLLPCLCEVPALAELTKENVPLSINQAYTLISTHFEPHRRAHTGNAFDLVFYRQEPLDVWQSLRHLRERRQADHEVSVVSTKPDPEPSINLLAETPKRAGLAEAIALAAEAHVKQFDKAGAPYILHPLRMMQRLDTEDERIVAAVLHDVVEDTTLTFDDLMEHGFTEQVVSAVKALTKREGEPYEQFVERARQHPLARRVKIADIEDNLDLLRLSEVTDKDVDRLRKYHSARHRLLNGEAR